MSAAQSFEDMIHFSWGMTYSAFLGEAWPMARRHWNEVGTFRNVLQLNPDHDRYRALERDGRLHILAARSDQFLVGYLFMLVVPHPRDKVARVARDDLFYVDPNYRRFHLGPAMIESALTHAEGRADIIMLSTKARRTMARGPHGGTYLQRHGFEPLETVWGKVLRNPHEDQR